RSLASMLPRQSPSSLILSSISREGVRPVLDLLFCTIFILVKHSIVPRLSQVQTRWTLPAAARNPPAPLRRISRVTCALRTLNAGFTAGVAHPLDNSATESQLQGPRSLGFPPKPSTGGRALFS